MLEHVVISKYGNKHYEMDLDSAKDMLENECTFSHMEYPAWAWPGGYPIYYVTKDAGILCPRCANEHLFLTLDEDDAQWFIVAQYLNYEDDHLFCDHCGEQVEAAYGGEE